MRTFINLSIFSLLCVFFSCKNEGTKKAEPMQKPEYQTSKFSIQPEWSRSAVLYELNVRQFSEAGNLAAVQAALPRLKQTGVDVIWLMPIFPISEKNRKGSLGSPYAVQDYKEVNPDYGTVEDLTKLVQAAHAMDMKIILDWVPNHTGWDNVWLAEHSDYFTKYKGELTVPLNEHGEPIEDWSDVMDLDYSNPNMRLAMIDALAFWVKTCDIDGYRFDMAGLVPNDFWQEVRPAMDSIKHLFMLAEWQEEPQHFNSAFQHNYGWRFKDVTKEIAAGKKPASALIDLKMELDSFYPAHYSQLYFTTNHDENTWNGNDKDLYGDAFDAMTVLTFTWQGMPMFYNGQESVLEQKLAFFEKEAVHWKKFERAGLYMELSALRKNHPSLQNRPYGSEPIVLPTDKPASIYAFLKEKDNDTVFCLFNFSDKAQKISLQNERLTGTYANVLNSEQAKEMQANAQKGEKNLAMFNTQTRFEFSNETATELSLAPWGFMILENVR